MTIDAYFNPDFDWTKKLIFLSAAFAGILLCVLLICLGTKLTSGRNKDLFHERTHDFVQRFYEMIISGTSVMSFSCAYVIINHVYSLVGGSGQYGTFVTLWENGKDFILLLLICLSCVLNTILDRLIIPLKKLDKSKKASIRLLGMFYVILILLYLNIIGDESEYNPVMLYYLGLMVGRFVYFDASFSDFCEAIKNAFFNLPLLIMGLALSAVLCRFGFGAGYLLERNYYIVGVFYTHLFMLAAIFILHHSHILQLLIRKPKAPRQDTEKAGSYQAARRKNRFAKYDESDTGDVYDRTSRDMEYEDEEEAYYEEYEDGYEEDDEYLYEEYEDYRP